MLKKTKRRVAHFVRKFLPPFSSFIRNQIVSHDRYEAHVIYKEFVDSSFARQISTELSTFYCDHRKNGLSKIYSESLYRRPLRRLTHGDRVNIKHYLRAMHIDIAHFHYGTDAGVFLGALKNLGLPSLVSFYGYDCSSFPGWYFGYGRHYLQRVFKSVNYCLAMSEDMKSDLLRIGCPERKIIVHYYGTDVRRFHHSRQYRNKDEVVFLIVSYLVPQKGHMFLLKAFNECIKKANNKVVLRIVGTGYLEARLKQFVVDNGLTERVHFVGALNHLTGGFLKEFIDADVFVHPSVVSEKNEKEGIPGAVVEAMASGLPVISTYHAGIPYVMMHNDTGYLVKEWDIDALASVMCEFAEDVKLRKKIGQRGQLYAMENLDLKQKQMELENIYDHVIEAKVGGR